MIVEERLLRNFPILRKKFAECERAVRDVKVWIVYDELRRRGESYSETIRHLASRFGASASTIKRAVRKMEAYQDYPDRSLH
ncbi:MAG: hypothetical protein C0609_00170 [Deltaproteobacteria bacterium]|nr:MAG: hypothetical protein C0609_00170 [Deltaproteobacteria bacterium]